MIPSHHRTIHLYHMARKTPAPSPGEPRSGSAASGEWLLLIHALPTSPAYLRVKVARRLRRLGAVSLKSTVYVLPRRDETTEDFGWLRREIVAAGGEATVAAATFLEGLGDREVRAMFERERDAEYAELAAAARAAAEGAATAEDVGRLRRRLDEIVGRDHFGAAGRAAAEHALAALAARLLPPAAGAAAVTVERPRGATWVTRRDPHVDRLGTAWLIRRFVDPEARFRFVDPATYRHAPGELRFDMYEGELGHEGDRCTFETALARFGLDEPGLPALAEVIHDLDCKDGRFGRPEAPGVEAAVRGLAAAYADDEERLAAAMPLFSALHAWFRERG